MFLDMSSNWFEVLPRKYPVGNWPNRYIFDAKLAILEKIMKIHILWYSEHMLSQKLIFKLDFIELG